MEDKTILEKIMDQNHKIMDFMVEQNKTNNNRFNSLGEDISQLKGEMNQRFDRIEMAVLENSSGIKENSSGIKENSSGIKENSSGIKENGTKIDRVEIKLDTAITNHEGRIRKLEEKVSI